MATLVIHTKNGSTITAPIEAWIVALITGLPSPVQQEVLKRVASMNGATLIPDKYLFKEDELGTVCIVERPTVDLGGRI